MSELKLMIAGGLFGILFIGILIFMYNVSDFFKKNHKTFIDFIVIFAQLILITAATIFFLSGGVDIVFHSITNIIGWIFGLFIFFLIALFF